LVAPHSSAEIFKCLRKDGLDLYQNFPCEIHSLGSLPSQSSGAAAPSAPVDANQAKPGNTTPIETVAAARSTSANEPRAGMTEAEVKAIWGDPVEIVQDEPVTGRIDIWQYRDGRTVQFNNKHRVVALQR